MTDTLARAPHGVSFLRDECDAFTVPIDPGPGNTAVAAVRGATLLNAGVFRPRVGGALHEEDVLDADRELWTPSGSLVSLFDPKPDGRFWTNAEAIDILHGVARRVRFARDWLVDMYADPDEPVHAVVEVPDGVPHGWSARAKMLTLELAGMIRAELDCATFSTTPRLTMGERHQAARNPTREPVPVELCYSPLIHDSWAEWALPGLDGTALRMLPNDDVGRRGGDDLEKRRRCRDAQAAEDIAKAYWKTERELGAYLLRWDPSRKRTGSTARGARRRRRRR